MSVWLLHLVGPIPSHCHSACHSTCHSACHDIWTRVCPTHHGLQRLRAPQGLCIIPLWIPHNSSWCVAPGNRQHMLAWKLVSTFTAHTFAAPWVQTSWPVDYCDRLQLISASHPLPPAVPPCFPCVHTHRVPRTAAALIMVTQRLGPAVALLKAFQCLPVVPRVGSQALPLPCLVPLSSYHSPLPLRSGRSSPKPPTPSPSYPPGGASPTLSPNPLSQTPHGCSFTSVRSYLKSNLMRKTCTPQTIKYQPLFPVRAPRALALLWSAAMHLTMNVCYIIYINFMLCRHCLMTWFLKLEAFKFLFTAVSLTCKIVLILTRHWTMFFEWMYK